MSAYDNDAELKGMPPGGYPRACACQPDTANYRQMAVMLTAERDAQIEAKTRLAETVTRLAAERDALSADYGKLLAESNAYEVERDALKAEVERLNAAANAWNEECCKEVRLRRALETDNERLRGELQLANISCATLNDQCVRLRAEVATTKANFSAADASQEHFEKQLTELREGLESLALQYASMPSGRGYAGVEPQTVANAIRLLAKVTPPTAACVECGALNGNHTEKCVYYL